MCVCVCRLDGGPFRGPVCLFCPVRGRKREWSRVTPFVVGSVSGWTRQVSSDLLNISQRLSAPSSGPVYCDRGGRSHSGRKQHESAKKINDGGLCDRHFLSKQSGVFRSEQVILCSTLMVMFSLLMFTFRVCVAVAHCNIPLMGIVPVIFLPSSLF